MQNSNSIPLHSTLSWSCHSVPTLSLIGTTNVHSTPIWVADEWRNNGSPGGSHFPLLAQGLIWFAPAWGTDLGNKSGLRSGGGSPYEAAEGTGIQIELNSLYSILGSRLGRTQGSTDNDIKGTFRRLFIVRKWRPWMVTELEWGLLRWCVCLVTDHCGHSMGARQGDSPFFSQEGVHPSRRPRNLQSYTNLDLQHHDHCSLVVGQNLSIACGSAWASCKRRRVKLCMLH